MKKRHSERHTICCDRLQVFPRTVERCGSQWRTQKIFMGRASFNGRWWSFVFGVRCLWRHNLTSYSCFQAKFVDIICISFYKHSSYFCKKSSPIHSPYNKVFAKYQAQGGVLTPKPPPCARPWWQLAMSRLMTSSQRRLGLPVLRGAL